MVVLKYDPRVRWPRLLSFVNGLLICGLTGTPLELEPTPAPRGICNNCGSVRVYDPAVLDPCPDCLGEL